MVYIATFFSHFGAIRFHKQLKDQNIPAKMMPVPRAVSSSCGTCVRFEYEGAETFRSSDVEAMFRTEPDGTMIEMYSNL